MIFLLTLMWSVVLISKLQCTFNIPQKFIACCTFFFIFQYLLPNSVAPNGASYNVCLVISKLCKSGEFLWGEIYFMLFDITLKCCLMILHEEVAQNYIHSNIIAAFKKMIQSSQLQFIVCHLATPLYTLQKQTNSKKQTWRPRLSSAMSSSLFKRHPDSLGPGMWSTTLSGTPSSTSKRLARSTTNQEKAAQASKPPRGCGRKSGRCLPASCTRWPRRWAWATPAWAPSSPTTSRWRSIGRPSLICSMQLLRRRGRSEARCRWQGWGMAWQSLTRSSTSSLFTTAKLTESLKGAPRASQG